MKGKKIKIYPRNSLLIDYGFADNSSSWNDAFSWGDHSLAGYLTSETITSLTTVGTIGAATLVDGVLNIPVYSGSSGTGGQVDTVVGGTDITVDSTDPINPIINFTGTYFTPSDLTTDYGFTDNSTNWDLAYGWGDHSTAGYLTSFTEVDPIFTAHTVSSIIDGTGFLKNNGSGTWSYDNSTYLTSYTETDPVFTASDAFGITATNITNWNAAFGWGDHASLYLPIATQLAQTKALVAGEFLTSYNATTGLFTSATPPNDNNYVTGLSFSTTTGVLTATRSGLTSVTVDLDGRYLESVVGGVGITIDNTDPINPIITNSSPDRTVSLATPESVKVSGTYPDFSLSLVGDAASPSDNFFYGTNSGGTKGWYGITSSIVSYDNTTSGLTATNVQAAIDEIVAGGGGGGVTSVGATLPIISSGGTTPNISHSTASGYVHLPSGGSANQYLKWLSDGTGQWANLPTEAKPDYNKTIRMLSPTAGQEGTIFFTTVDITVRELHDVVVGSGSTTWVIYFASARNSVSPSSLFSASRTTSSEAGASATTFNDATIPADSWIWIEIVGNSGSINELAVNLTYNVD